MIFIILLVLLATVIFWKITKHYSYWTDRGVKQRKQLYLLGDQATILLGTESMYESVINMYNAFPNERYIGIYQTIIPTLLIRDPELIKQLTVKNFDHFLNHRDFIPDDADPLWNKNLFALKDTKWRDMRSTLSPSFTSSKLKIMFSLITECAEDFVNHLLKDGQQILEVKDIFSRFTNDIIASVAFGVRCNSLRDRNNKFYTMGTKATSFGAFTYLKIFLYMMVPKLFKFTGIRLFPTDVSNFFYRVIKEAIFIRETEGIVRSDMLNLLLEARTGKNTFNVKIKDLMGGSDLTEKESITANVPKQELTDLDIAAQALIFFFAGFESVATLMSFTCYELALNTDIQRKLQNEIDDTLEICKGKLNYDPLMKMKYMDMVISETLRKWPGAVVTDRVCSKQYTIEPTRNNEKPIHIKPGEIIWVPITGLHYDEKYFPNPNEFNPERFSDTNKENIHPFTYLPFGAGPRNCIGSRFALMETKAILFYLLSKFDLLVCAKTNISLQITKRIMQLRAEKGIWIELKPRNK